MGEGRVRVWKGLMRTVQDGAFRLAVVLKLHICLVSPVFTARPGIRYLTKYND